MHILTPATNKGQKQSCCCFKGRNSQAGTAEPDDELTKKRVDTISANIFFTLLLLLAVFYTQ